MKKSTTFSISDRPSSQYLHFEDNLFALLKYDRHGGRGGANLLSKGPQTQSASERGGVINYDDDDNGNVDDDDDDDFDDDNDDDDVISSFQRTKNMISTKGGR